MFKLNHRKSIRIASIVGDSFVDHKDERALMAAMIDELSKGTRYFPCSQGLCDYMAEVEDRLITQCKQI